MRVLLFTLAVAATDCGPGTDCTLEDQKIRDRTLSDNEARVLASSATCGNTMVDCLQAKDKITDPVESQIAKDLCWCNDINCRRKLEKLPTNDCGDKKATFLADCSDDTCKKSVKDGTEWGKKCVEESVEAVCSWTQAKPSWAKYFEPCKTECQENTKMTKGCCDKKFDNCVADTEKAFLGQPICQIERRACREEAMSQSVYKMVSDTVNVLLI